MVATLTFKKEQKLEMVATLTLKKEQKLEMVATFKELFNEKFTEEYKEL